jgi:hypothetical protein
VDEMKITPGFQNDISLKEVLGFCTMPNGTGEYEEHAEHDLALWALHEVEVDDLL